MSHPTCPRKRCACIQSAYGLTVSQVSFLPLGADLNAAVYRALAQDGQAYFLKLKRGAFDEVGVTLPRFLHNQGIPQVIAPRLTQAGRLWTDLHDFRVILYPFIQGRSGFEVELSPRQWRDFGAALKRVHTTVLPAGLSGSIPAKPTRRSSGKACRASWRRCRAEVLDEPVAVKVAELLKAKSG